MKRILLALTLTALTTFLQAQDVSSVRLNEILATGSLLKSPANRPMDRVELFNTSLSAVDLGGCTLGDSSGLAKYTFPLGSIIPAQGFFYVNLDPDVDFGIQARGDIIFFRNIDGFTVDAVTFGFQVLDKSIGRVPDGFGQWSLTETNFGSSNVLAPLGDPRALRINEWQSTSPDFFELYNTSDKPVALTGLRVADAELAVQPWWNWTVIGDLSFIGTGRSSGFVVFEDPALPFNSGLNKDGDAIYLATAEGEMIDQVAITADANNAGRVPDGGSTIEAFPKRVTKGKPNFGALTKIVVSEILAHTDPPLEDAIEFYNTTDEVVDMSGWWMSDKQSRPSRFVFPQGTVVPAKGYYVLYEYQFRHHSDPSDYTFNSAHGDTNFLYEVDTTTGNALAYSEVRFPASMKGYSFGRVLTTDGDVDYFPMASRTFGQDGALKPGTAGLQQFRQGQGLTNAVPVKWGPVIINEVMYRPPDLNNSNNTVHEYIELRNVTSRPVKLYETLYRAPWRLGGKGNVFYQFATTDVIPPNGHMLIVSFSPANAALLSSFKTAYGLPDSTLIRGPYNGGTNFLDRDTTIELFRPDKPENDANDFGFVPQLMVDRVHYELDQYWPTNSSGTGTSLQRVSGSSYGDEPTAWFDDYPTPGWPNAQRIVVRSEPTSHGVLLGDTATLSVSVEVASMTTPSSVPTFQWLFKNKPILNANTDTLTIPNFQKPQAGKYTCVISNFAGKVVTPAAILKPVLPVVIKKMLPASPLTVPTGKTVLFKPIATGTKPNGSKSFVYQWFKDDVLIPGQTAATLKLTGVTPDQSGTYKVIVSNDLSSDEAEVVLTVE